MDLFQALPDLRKHPLLHEKEIALIGVSTIVCDEKAYYFEITKPRTGSAPRKAPTIKAPRSALVALAEASSGVRVF